MRRGRRILLSTVLLGSGMARGALLADSLVAVSGPSPFQSCAQDAAEAQPGKYYAASEVEPRLAVNPIDRNNLVATFQQDRWSNGGARGLLVSVSFDAGRSWREVVIPGISLCSGGRYSRVSDPWLSFAPNGDLYHVSLALGVDLLDPPLEPGEPHGRQRPDLPGVPVTGESAMLVSKSTDGGLSWGAPITLIHDAGGALNDKQSVTADPTDPTSRLVYVVWDRLSPSGTAGPGSDEQSRVRGPVMFSRTTDGGASWEPARALYDPGPGSSTLGNQILVLPDGTLLDFFTEFVLVPDGRGGGYYSIYFSSLRSTDKGRTWSGVRRVSPLLGSPVVDPERPRAIRTGGLLVDVAVDALSGALYAVWTQRVQSLGGRTYLGAIQLLRSSDAGNLWVGSYLTRAPVAYSLNDQVFTPTVSISPRGIVGVTYYDFRGNDAGAGALADHWLIRCDPSRPAGCSRDDPSLTEARVTDLSFDIEHAPYAYGLFVGDYEGLVTDGEDFLVLFAQPHGVDPGSVFFRRVRP